MLTSLVFFILVLLIPVFTLAQFQYMNLQSVASLALLQIISGLLLLLLWTYLIRHRKRLMTQEEVSTTDKRYMYSRLALIPCLYVVTISNSLFCWYSSSNHIPSNYSSSYGIARENIWFRKEEKYH